MAALVLLALLVRILIALAWPAALGDSEVYITVARNIFYNSCVSLSEPASAACLPHWGGNQPPGYPAFMAGIFGIFGESLAAVRIAQAVVAAGAVFWLLRAVAKFSGSAPVTLIVGIILALSPNVVAWPRLIFSDSIAITATMWVFAELLLSIHQRRFRAVSIGLGLLLAVSVRYDNAFLAVPIAVCGFAVVPWRRALIGGAICAAVVAVPAGVWTVRNVAVGLSAIPQFTAAEGRVTPRGYLLWGTNWVKDEYELAKWGFPVLAANFGEIRIPERAYVSPLERETIANLLLELEAFEGKPFPAHIDDEFERLGRARQRAAPLNFWVWMPIRRATNMWVNHYSSGGFPSVSESSQLSSDLLLNRREGGLSGLLALAKAYPKFIAFKAASTGHRWLLLLAVGALVLMMFSNRISRDIKVVIIVTLTYFIVRSMAFSFRFSTVTRYIVEIIPMIEVAAVLTIMSARNTRSVGER